MVRDQVQDLNKLALAQTGSALSTNAKAGDKCTWELKHFRKGRREMFRSSQIVNRKYNLIPREAQGERVSFMKCRLASGSGASNRAFYWVFLGGGEVVGWLFLIL